MAGQPVQKQLVNQLDGLRLFLIDHKAAVRPPVIAQEPLVSHTCLAIGKPFPLSPGGVFRNAPALLLGKAGHDGDEQFALGIQCPDILFFKINLHTFFF